MAKINQIQVDGINYDIEDASAVHTETDPVFTESAASEITSSDIENWNNKADKEETNEQIEKSLQIYNALPKVSGTGEELTLDDTAECWMPKFQLKGNTSQASLPSSYQAVEYIENSGTQYINTGVSPKYGIGFEITAELLTENNTDKILIGSRTNSDNTRFWVDFDGTNVGVENQDIKYGYGNYDSTHVNYSLNTKYNIIFNYNNNSKITINGTDYTMLTTPDYTNSIPMYIFKANYTSDMSGNFKVYSCKIYDGTTIIRNMIPCYRISDNEIGMYDLVNNVFYTNQGTGTFVKGNNISIPNPDYPQDIHVVTGDNEVVISNSDSTKSQTYSITLGDLEVCGIGDYEDEFVKQSDGKWYLKKNIGKVVLNGSEDNYGIYVENENKTVFYNGNFDKIETYNSSQAIPRIISNYFYPISQADTWPIGSLSRRTQRQAEIYFTMEPNTTLNDFKEWLSTHNAILYYILATPTNIEITDTTLISQLEAIKNAMSYQDQTNISQVNDDAPLNIKVSAVYDLNKLVSRVATLETE